MSLIFCRPWGPWVRCLARVSPAATATLAAPVPMASPSSPWRAYHSVGTPPEPANLHKGSNDKLSIYFLKQPQCTVYWLHACKCTLRVTLTLTLTLPGDTGAVSCPCPVCVCVTPPRRCSCSSSLSLIFLADIYLPFTLSHFSLLSPTKKILHHLATSPSHNISGHNPSASNISFREK